MPRLDGWGLCEEIRKLDRLTAINTASLSASNSNNNPSNSSRQQQTIVIGMSAARSNNDGRVARAGMDGFLVKPFRLDEMMGIITARAGSPDRARASASAGVSASTSIGRHAYIRSNGRASPRASPRASANVSANVSANNSANSSANSSANVSADVSPSAGARASAAIGRRVVANFNARLAVSGVSGTL
jgi:CheY-like chemotaxis protein